MGELNRRKTWRMTSHILFLLFPLVARCLGQKNPCEGISLEGGDCAAPADPATGLVPISGTALPPCAQVTSSECSRDQPFIVYENQHESEEECISICHTFAAIPTMGCTFAAWKPGVVLGTCTLYNEPFADYIANCQLLAGPPDISRCSVENPEENSCDVIRQGECVQRGHVAEVTESIGGWMDCANICKGSPSSSCKAWSYRDEPIRRCSLYDSAEQDCTISYTPSGIDPDDCEGEDTATGILVIGGHPDATARSVEFWSAADPEQGSCVLNYYPRWMHFGPTVNLVSDRLVACYEDTCEIYQEGSWQYLQDTKVRRYYHSSATTKDAVLLIGGLNVYSTEWIPVDGSAAHQGPFTVRHGWGHCTIQLSDDIIVMTGGLYTESYATQYNMVEGNETPLTSLGQPRDFHACGVYQDAGGQQVLIVTGGLTYRGADSNCLSTTEVATYTGGGSQLEWRETGELPTPRSAPRAALVDNVIYVTGGEDDDGNGITAILSWDPSTESWQQAGNLILPRSQHAAVAIPSSIIETECSAMFLKSFVK